MTAVSLAREGDVAVLLFDTPGASVNIVSSELLAEMQALVRDVAGDASISACVLASAKPDVFVAGADLHEFLAMSDPAEGEAFSRQGQEILLAIERSRKPYVAAIHGAALGSGLDVALACRYRLATEHPRTVLGFPETTLGLIPGGGGTQRLPRLVGLSRALGMLLDGSRLAARQALRAQLVDALVPPGGLMETAVKAARALTAGTLAPRRHLEARDRLLALPIARDVLFSRTRRAVLRKTRGFYPAPISLLDCVAEGYRSGPSAGLAREATLFGRLVVGSDAKNLIRLFDATKDLRKTPPARPVRRVAIVGAGLMGEGIAAVSLPVATVVLKDVSDEALARTAKKLYGTLERRRRSGILGAAERDRRWFGLHVATDAGAVAVADVVIEAVFEDLELKRRVLAECERAMPKGAVFASNTSALPIRDIARDAAVPSRVLGMHYFSPASRMPLVEIVVAAKTSEASLATALAFAVAQGKTPIVVRDGPGFYTTRILAPYLNEALVLLEEGAAVPALDRALVDFGFLVGPAGLLDEVGIDVGAHVSRELAPLFAARGTPPTDSFARLVAAGYLGKKNGLGFYRPRVGRARREPNPDVYALLGGAPRREVPAREMAERCVLAMVNEAVHCLGEGALGSARDGDVGAILGLGFPPFRGGPFRYVDALGASAVAARLAALAERHGPRFAPAPLLLERAKDERRFTSP